MFLCESVPISPSDFSFILTDIHKYRRHILTGTSVELYAVLFNGTNLAKAVAQAHSHILPRQIEMGQIVSREGR